MSTLSTAEAHSLHRHRAAGDDRETLARSPDVQTRRVFLAEDDPMLRTLFAETLVDAGFEVHTAADGVAMALLLSSPPDGQLPDVIVMDVRMPRVSGIDVLAELERRGLDMPVILVTGFGDPALYTQATSAGAVVVLDKPVGPDELATMVRLVATLGTRRRISRQR
jgi:two-component system C4-dicarboxylate transport response regulator DctD